MHLDENMMLTDVFMFICDIVRTYAHSSDLLYQRAATAGL